MEDSVTPRIRVDKWLWHARFFKSRTLAAKLASSGKLRVNRGIVSKPGATVKPGDVLTFAKGHDIRVIEIVALGERRGPASDAQMLYKDLSLPQPKTKTPPGAGRPTKEQRRAIDRFRGEAARPPATSG